MDVGEPLRVLEVEPVEDPVPQEPEQVEEPAEPELVPAQGPVREVATVDDTRHAVRGKDAGSVDIQAYRRDRGRRIAPRDACQAPWFTSRTGP